MRTEAAARPAATATLAPRRETVVVLGLGYVGLPVALSCAESGFEVIGVDTDLDRVRLVGRAEVDDPAVFSLVRALECGALRVTGDAAVLAQADLVFICVPTPLEEGEAHHEAVRSCARAFARYGRPDALVILESTVRPGFVEKLRALLGHGGRVALAYAPERIDPQRSQDGLPLREIPRLVAGVDVPARERAARVLRQLGVAAHPVPLRVAEYAKLLENAYRLLNVAFIDEFAAVCRAEGIDPRAVIQAAATKPFGFQAFWPGVGAGGHCVAVDPAFLTHRGRALGQRLPLLEQALHSNARRPKAVAAAVAAHTDPGDTVLVVGLTYKAGVPDTRQSAAVAAARTLAGMNRRVLAFDPLVDAPDDLLQVGLADGLRCASAVALFVAQPEPVVSKLRSSGLQIFDATGSFPDAARV